VIASYGFKDGGGEFYVSIDTDKCAECTDKPCVAACPESALEIVEDDYEDEVIAVVKEHRKKIKYTCAPCMPTAGRRDVMPCFKACSSGAIKHSW
jgi:Fe-S-cluster-containing hydrogenase component 2